MRKCSKLSHFTSPRASHFASPCTSHFNVLCRTPSMCRAICTSLFLALSPVCSRCLSHNFGNGLAPDSYPTLLYICTRISSFFKSPTLYFFNKCVICCLSSRSPHHLFPFCTTNHPVPRTRSSESPHHVQTTGLKNKHLEFTIINISR